VERGEEGKHALHRAACRRFDAQVVLERGREESRAVTISNEGRERRQLPAGLLEAEVEVVALGARLPCEQTRGQQGAPGGVLVGGGGTAVSPQEEARPAAVAEVSFEAIDLVASEARQVAEEDAVVLGEVAASGLLALVVAVAAAELGRVEDFEPVGGE